MADQSDVWLIVPVYNEASVVATVLSEALGTFPNIVCVDDGSTDGSVAQIATTAARLVRHPVNLGQGAALQTGIEYARARPGARYLVTFDADGQHRIIDAVAMVDRLRSGEADVVLGSRFTGGAQDIPGSRRFALRLAVALSPRLRRLGLTDTHNGLRAFTADVAAALQLRSNGMAHASELVALVDQHGWRIVEQPVTIHYSDYSLAKGQSLLNGVNVAFDSAVRPRPPRGRAPQRRSAP